MFIDEVEISVKAGDGGNGIISFLREKYRPRGGPAGGDGGRGGNVFFRVDRNMHTLMDLRGKPLFKAERGRDGGAKNMSGKGGKDRFIRVPPGTVVRNMETGEVMLDCTEDGREYMIAEGGRGGLGNQHFATPTRQAPRKQTDGKPGEEFGLKLELKIISDVGLIGLPNAGKSTLITAISNARPKIADYPFTTLIPNVGMVKKPGGDAFTVADIPGLVENASEGKGLGIRFLKHVERTRVLVLLAEFNPDPDGWIEGVKTIRGELEKFSPELAAKPWILALSKIDTIDEDERQLLLEEACEAFPDKEIIPFSSATRENVDTLISRTISLLEEHIEAQKVRIGLFGGTFDPVHKGHVEVAKMALERFELDKVLFMPANIPPHKIGKQIGRPQHRLEMLRLATDGESRFEVSEFEIKAGGRSYTIDTIRHLLSQDARQEIYLIVGFDNVSDIMTWREIEEYPRLCHIIAVSREGFNWDEIKVKLTREVYNRIEVVKDFDFPAHAEVIRENLSDEKLLGEVLPPEVWGYIREHGLYQ